MEHEERLDKLFVEAFETNHPAMHDWAKIKMELRKGQMNARGVFDAICKRLDETQSGDDFLNFSDGYDIAGDGYGKAIGFYLEREDVKRIIAESLGVAYEEKDE